MSGDDRSSTFTEIAPYLRWLAAKERDGVPVSVAIGLQYFADNFEGDDSGSNVMVAFVGESYTFGGGDPDRAAYLARTLGLIWTSSLGPDGRSLLRFEVEGQSFRRETYRAARVGYVRRF